MKGSAMISADQKYRYVLRRQWGDLDGRQVCWIMQNPSTADDRVDDPTIRRCIGFSQRWGYDSLVVVNLWPYRATNPFDPAFRRFVQWERNGPDWYARDVIHFQNLPLIVLEAASSELTVCAWGATSEKLDPGFPDHVKNEIFHTTGELWCLGTTKDGSPRHPLYVPKDYELEVFE